MKVALRSITSEGAGLSGSCADQGTNFAVVVKVPQPGGVISGLRPPSRKWKEKEEKGSWGTLRAIETSWPVCGSGLTSIGCLTRTPRSGTLAIR